MVWDVGKRMAQTMRNVAICPGVDVCLEFKADDLDDLSVFLFWSSPNGNTNWYPICQIDHGDKTIFHREGGENHESWGAFLSTAADVLENLNAHG